MALIYQSCVDQKNGCTYISTQISAFINMDVNVGYAQIPRQLSARVRKFENSLDSQCRLCRVADDFVGQLLEDNTNAVQIRPK